MIQYFTEQRCNVPELFLLSEVRVFLHPVPGDQILLPSEGERGPLHSQERRLRGPAGDPPEDEQGPAQVSVVWRCRGVSPAQLPPGGAPPPRGPGDSSPPGLVCRLDAAGQEILHRPQHQDHPLVPSSRDGGQSLPTVLGCNSAFLFRVCRPAGRRWRVQSSEFTI